MNVIVVWLLPGVWLRLAGASEPVLQGVADGVAQSCTSAVCVPVIQSATSDAVVAVPPGPADNVLVYLYSNVYAVPVTTSVATALHPKV